MVSEYGQGKWWSSVIQSYNVMKQRLKGQGLEQNHLVHAMFFRNGPPETRHLVGEVPCLTLSTEEHRGAKTSRFHPPPCLPQDVTPVDPIQQGMEAALRGSLGCDPESTLQLAHFVDHRMMIGVSGSGPAGHALARPCSVDLTTAGTLRSSRVVRPEPRRYYDPLGRPLRRARFRRRLIRGARP